jgi:hypothetical protein
MLEIQKFISKGFFYLSGLLLIFSVIAIGLAWFRAFQDGRVPDVWGTYEGNHGPWRHYGHGGNLIWSSIKLQIISFFSAIISLLVKSSRRGIWLALISILFFIILMCTHYWLVD